ncbi:hypothetical protein CONLIGDRAFT_656785 [Coniochaeta ligniaria NRRL 30616]|uniref:Uncharacterized protein n=1 Tax=Coniochaeta ligniaria NRRL 30616 TaxID=1408157 RepID=A0A1J7IBD0_9PEZI|nr:hypothetical protein CONLIGDRAFT_656785 [Coniochaeta ligniaria NRRL 30616]
MPYLVIGFASQYRTTETKQRRLTEYERLGIQATLGMLRVSDAKVSEFLRYRDPNPVDIQLVKTHLPSRAKAATSNPRVSSVTVLLNLDQPKTLLVYSSQLGLLPRSSPPTSEGISPIKLPAIPSTDNTSTSSATWPSFGESIPLHLRTPDFGRKSDIETSYDDTNRAQVVLGCTSLTIYIIKNTKVFNLLDEVD